MLIIADLFDTAGFSITKEPKLLPYAKAMFASILQYLDKMISDFGMKNIIVKRVIESSEKFGVRSKTLLNWGTVVRADFQSRNSTRLAQTDSAYVAHVISGLQMEVIAMRGAPKDNQLHADTKQSPQKLGGAAARSKTSWSTADTTVKQEESLPAS